MILTGCVTPMISLTDIAVLGRLTEVYFLSAANVGSAVITFLYLVFAFLRMATTGLCAQFSGAGDKEGLMRVVAQSLLLSWACAALLITLQTPITTTTEWLFETEQKLVPLIGTYIDIRLLSAPATFTHYILWGLFLGLNKATYPLFLIAFIGILNVILDVLFVFVFDMDVQGVALASVIAEYAGLIIGFVLFVRISSENDMVWRLRHIKPNMTLLRLMSVNRHLFVRTLMLLSVFAFFSMQSTRQGTVVVAANTILLNLLLGFAFIYDGIAYALETLCGQAMGKNDKALLGRIMRAGYFWGWIFAVAFGVLFLSGGTTLVAALTTLPEVREYAGGYLYWLCVFPLISMSSYFYDGVFIGLLRFKEMRNAMLASIFFVYLPLFYWLQPWGNHGLWAALTGFMILRAGLMTLYYRHMRKSGTLFAARFVA